MSPDRPDAEWHSVLYMDDGANFRAVTHRGRIQWVPTLDELGGLRDDRWTLAPLEQPEVGEFYAADDRYCDISRLLYELDGPGRMGDPRWAYGTLDALDDLVLTIDHPLESHDQEAIGQFLDGLLDETPPDSVLASVGRGRLMEAVMSSLGRVFANSDFRREALRPCPGSQTGER